jgi:uncharacterized protein
MAPRNIAGTVVRGPDFWGREGDVNAMWRLLERGSVLLTAPRRWGKSSLMSALQDVPRPAWTVLQLNVEYVETPAEFLNELTAALLQKDPIVRVLRKAMEIPSSLVRWVSGVLSEVGVSPPGIGEVKLKLREAFPGAQAWPELAEQLLAQLRRIEGSLLLIVDEFPMMMANILDRDEAKALHFLKWFRAQRQTQGGQIRFLLGGSVNIEPRLEQLASEALLNDLERFHLRPLPRDRAVEFVREVLGAEGVSFEAGTPERIVDVVGVGVHYFLQVLISECLSEVRYRGQKLTVRDIQPIYEARVLGPPSRARFSHYHSRLKANYGLLEEPARLVLAELTRAPDRDLVQLQQLLQAHGYGSVNIEALIARLESDYYVSRTADRVLFQSNFLKDWWLQNAPGPRRSA